MCVYLCACMSERERKSIIIRELLFYYLFYGRGKTKKKSVNLILDSGSYEKWNFPNSLKSWFCVFPYPSSDLFFFFFHPRVKVLKMKPLIAQVPPSPSTTRKQTHRRKLTLIELLPWCPGRHFEASMHSFCSSADFFGELSMHQAQC